LLSISHSQIGEGIANWEGVFCVRGDIGKVSY